MGHHAMTVEQAIALIGVSIAIPNGILAALLVYLLREIRSIHTRITALEQR